MPYHRKDIDATKRASPQSGNNSIRSLLTSPEPIQSLEYFKEQISRAADFRIKRKRPFIVISYAQSVDGSIAARNRAPILLSGQESMRLTHHIRACCDSILIGIGTVLTDNPLLTARLVAGKNPQPIILDTRLRTPVDSKLVKRSDLSPWLVNGERNSQKKIDALQNAGATVLSCATTARGKIDLNRLMGLLVDKGINSIMVEGGAEVITSFINEQIVDQFIITISPKLVGGLKVIDKRGLRVPPFLLLGNVEYQPLGDDLIMWARPVLKDE